MNGSEIFLVVFIILCSVLFLFSIYFYVYRNSKVFNIQTKWNHQCTNILINFLNTNGEKIFEERDLYDTYRHYEKIAESIRAIPYSNMVYSFKKITDEKWLDNRQINFLKLDNN